VVPSELLVHVKRSGRLNIDDRYIEWPLKPISIFQLKLRHLIRILIEVIKKKKSPETGRVNYESVTKSIYGDYLYRIFFGPLTEKFFKVNPTEIDQDWAFASIRSATKIEDSGFSSGNRYLVKDANPDTDFSLMRNVLDSFKNLFSSEEFYYFKNGYGELAESFKRKIVENGGVFSLSTSLVSIEKIDNRVASCTFLNLSGTSNVSFDSMLWTGSLE
jgi:protoporphyrinogen oxidase